MRIGELLDLAEAVEIDHEGISDFRGNHTVMLSRAVRELLAEAAPCGFDPPEVRDVVGAMLLFPPATWCAWVAADDARAMARMLLRAADEAEGK